MHTAITTGKCVVVALLALFLGVWTTGAESVFVHGATFEDNELGDFPEGAFTWGWGTPANGKFFYVTNVHACKSEKSLAIKILPNVGGMFGLQFPLKWENNPAKGVIVYEMDVMMECPISFYAEMRCPDGKYNVWYVGAELGLYSAHGRVGTTLTPEGGFKPFQWYHIRYTVPLTPDDAPAPTISLTDYATGKTQNETWDHPNLGPNPRLGDKFFSKPEAGMALMLNFYPHYYGSPGTFYFDNLKTTYE